jgi:hypothetical protein
MAAVRNRKEAADQFWSDVEDLLTQKYKHPAPKARAGIAKYRGAVDDGGKTPEAVYNQGEEQTARVIDAVIKKGLPTLAKA